MKAASIAVRIVDFLRQYPPFSFLPSEALTRLAATGRVKFHEGGEPVIVKGQPRDRFIYVIQQGTVRVFDGGFDEDAPLIDMRGPGDILGLNGIREDGPYSNTAVTEGDTILYALPREGFARLSQQNAQARRYLASYFTLNPAYDGPDLPTNSRATQQPITLRKGGLAEVEEPMVLAQEGLVTVSPETSMGDAARLLQSKRVDCVLATNAAGLCVGKLSDADIRDRVVLGDIEAAAPVERYLQQDLLTMPPGLNTGEILLRLTRSGKRFAIITQDGSVKSPVQGLLSERVLFLRYGRFPSVLGDAIAAAPDVATLRRLRDRMESLILEFLDSRSSLRWLLEMVSILNRKMAVRLVELCQEELTAEGAYAPGNFCWLMMGSGGREELLIRSAVYHCLVYEDPAEGEAETAAAYYEKLATRVSNGFRNCGFLESHQGVLASSPAWRLPLSALKAKFSALVADPGGQGVYDARDAFDFSPLHPACGMAASLRAHLQAEVAAHPDFIRHLARDSLLNQPPRTIFQDYVVDEAGIQSDELAIKAHALLPLVDVARVLNFQTGQFASTATYKRLHAVARQQAHENPLAARLLDEAAEAFLVAHYARVKRGLLSGSDGAVIQPSNLDAETRTLLKTAFRTILETLEYTARHFDLSLRQT